VNPKLKIYLAGAVLTNVPIFIFYYFFFSTRNLPLMVSSYILCFISSAISSISVSRNLPGKALKSGIINSFISYILYVLTTALILPTYVQDWIILLGIMIGGCIGSRVYELRAKGELVFSRAS